MQAKLEETKQQKRETDSDQDPLIASYDSQWEKQAQELKGALKGTEEPAVSAATTAALEAAAASAQAQIASLEVRCCCCCC